MVTEIAIIVVNDRAKELLYFTYKNHKDEVEPRRVHIYWIGYGVTQWHPEPQMLMHGYDADKHDARTFAMKDMTEVRYE